ncbi:hypothetical protein DL96DRAFT_1684206 [Flagelloscypha sp. PMI_526]|nr:hypothetical protein DL96DRAFT_1684206 [Flagelloscypha sp. PMI_526]
MPGSASKPHLSPETDGGGLRAISQALIIRDTLHRLEDSHQLSHPAKACDYFDMICGSGLGGILAIMCGILRMTGDQLVEEFVNLCKTVFSPHLDIAQRTFRLEEEMKKLVGKFSEGKEERKMFSEEDACKTFVCAAPASNASHTRLFRNYRARVNVSPDCTLWEAGRATTAVPDLFSPITIGPEYIGEVFVSGELGWNNPTEMLTEEASLVFKDRYVSCIINVGSGHPGHLSLSNGLADLFSRVATDCERASERMERRFRKVPSFYRRLSVDQGVQNLDVNLSTLHEVVSHAQSYLQGTRVTRRIDSLVLDLFLRPERISIDMISGVIPSVAEVQYPTHCPQPTAYFTGRQVELQTLQGHFTSDSNSCRVGVLYGIGGGGKTQIGLQFIQLYKDLFSEVFFVDASDQLTLENNLKAIANGSSDKPSVDDAMRLLRTRRENWLLFLDNADDTALDLHPYVSWPHGNVLITTRNRDVRSHAPKCNIWVDRLGVEDAMELLLRGVDVQESSEIQNLALKIVQELGCLALAINQARAFLASGLCTPSSYLRLYVKNRKSFMEDKSIQTTDEYEYTVYTTWAVSFNKLSPAAAQLFELLSYMHHESIPCRLFEEAWRTFEKEDENAVPPIVVSFLSSFTAVDSTWDVLRFLKLIREISSFSLFEFSTINCSVSLHPLVQQWAQYHSRHRQDIILAAQTLISLATPRGDSSEEYALRISLLPHLRESTKSGVQIHYSLLPRTGNIYRDGGMFRENLSICQRAFSETQQQLGSKDFDTLNCMGELALAHWSLGDNHDALKLTQEVLELKKQVMGNEHPETIKTMDNLTLVYSSLRQYQDALKLSEKVLKLRKRDLGNEHPDTLTTMYNIAFVYSNLGLYQDALKLNEEVLKLDKRVLGDEHPDTLSTMSSFAFVYSYLGQYQDALKLNEEVLEIRKQVLGNEHPHTLTTMSNLAFVYSDLGQYHHALKLNEEVLDVRKRVLGNEHPDTLTTMSNLALVHWSLGQYQDALKLNEEVLELRKEILGNHHPDTLTTMSHLSSVYSYLGMYQDSLEFHAHVLEQWHCILGSEHPNTINTGKWVVHLHEKLHAEDGTSQQRPRKRQRIT